MARDPVAGLPVRAERLDSRVVPRMSMTRALRRVTELGGTVIRDGKHASIVLPSVGVLRVRIDRVRVQERLLIALEERAHIVESKRTPSITVPGKMEFKNWRGPCLRCSCGHAERTHRYVYKGQPRGACASCACQQFHPEGGTP